MHSNETIDFHNTIAAQFDRKYVSSAAFLERFRVWTDLFSRYINPSDRVTDLGCGSGIFSNYLAGKGCYVIGIDGSATMIELCNRKKTSAHVHYVQQFLPLADISAYHPQDVVLMSSLLEYIDDIAQMIQQVRHLLKPNGLFIVSMPNALSVYRRTERILFQLIGQPRYVAYIRNRSTVEEFRRQLIDSGFEIIETAYFSTHDPVSTVLKPFLAECYISNLFVVVCRNVAG